LLRFRETFQSKYPLPFWIDAICINQTDILEKFSQVLQMGHIYWMAIRVMVWFGYPPERKKQTYDRLFDKINQIVRNTLSRTVRSHREVSNREAAACFADGLDDLEPLLLAYIEVLLNLWFSRV
jgi:hypothetical protein